MHVGFRYDFQKRRADTVEVYQAVIFAGRMNALAGISFQMSFMYANTLFLAIDGNRYRTVFDNRMIKPVGRSG